MAVVVTVVVGATATKLATPGRDDRRLRWVRFTVGDRVKMEMSPYDLDKARSVWRLK